MKKNRLWIIALVACVMIATTICYLTMRKSADAEYANGRIVDNGTDPDYGGVVYMMEWQAKANGSRR